MTDCSELPNISGLVHSSASVTLSRVTSCFTSQTTVITH